jgi:hypothetical protein
MARYRKMSVGFHQPMVVEPHSFSSILETISPLPLEKRVVEVNDIPFKLERLSRLGPFWEGEAIKVRTDSSPGKTRLDKEGVEDVLDEDEYIGEETAFLYHEATNIVVLQRNGYGVSSSALADALRKAAQIDVALILSHCLENDTAVRLDRFQDIRTIQLEIARVDESVLRGLGLSAQAIAKILRDSGAQLLNVEMKMGRERNGGLSEAARTLTDNLLKIAKRGTGEKKGVVQKLKVGGRIDPEETRVIDLLEPKMWEHMQFEHPAGRVPYEVRRSQLQKAWDRRAAELKKHYGRS